MSELALPPIELIRVLADGELHSGEELAQALNISRTAVWKQIKKLEAFGLSVESFASKGYKLQNSIGLLDLHKIKNALPLSINEQIGSIEIFSVIDSTNAYLLNQAADRKVRICSAEFQTNGRGRRGRAWISPFAQNIYLSLSKQVDAGLAGLDGLSLAVGVVLIEVLQSLGGKNLKLKWPNDILWYDGVAERKLGGILIEAQGDPLGTCKLVVGIGLNIQDNHYAEELIDQLWVCLEKVLEQRVERNDLLSRLLEALVQLLNNFERETFEFYKKRWLENCAYLNQPVQLGLAQEKILGRFVDVDNRGALVMETSQGLRSFHGGEISMRKFNEANQ